MEVKKNLNAFEKDLNKPKRGKSSFLHFCDDFKPITKVKFPDYTNKQLLSYLGILWKEYKVDKPETIKKYEKIAEQERDRYKKEMLIYKEETLDQNVEDKKDTDILEDIIVLDKNGDEETKKEKKEKKEKEKKKKEKENTENNVETEKNNLLSTREDTNDNDQKGFQKYTKKRKNKFMEEYPELNPEQLFQKMKKKWKSLSDEKKQKYLK